MHINFNGSYETASAETNLLSFLREHRLDPDQLVVEYNGHILSREAWKDQELHDGDAIVALSIVGGG